jgi:hypothetical protein
MRSGARSDSLALVNLSCDVQPDEVYNRVAKSQAEVSFETPEYTRDVTGSGTMRPLDSARASKIDTRHHEWPPPLDYSAPPRRSEVMVRRGRQTNDANSDDSS